MHLSLTFSQPLSVKLSFLSHLPPSFAFACAGDTGPNAGVDVTTKTGKSTAGYLQAVESDQAYDGDHGIDGNPLPPFYSFSTHLLPHFESLLG